MQASSAIPALHLAVQIATRQPCPSRAQLRRWVQTTLHCTPEAQAYEQAQFTLRFVDEAEAQRMNRDFRHRDYPTNVLTFAYDEPDLLAADIMLCAQVVEREALEQQKPLQHHYAHMVIHGVLHACGYDHEKNRDAEQMESLERMLLARFRIADPYA
jgi:probable rRNA maturation factor